jgi:hypothetical protein
MADCVVTVQAGTCTVCAVARQYTIGTANTSTTRICEDCLAALVRCVSDAKVQGWRTGDTAFSTAVDTALAEDGGRGHI